MTHGYQPGAQKRHAQQFDRMSLPRHRLLGTVGELPKVVRAAGSEAMTEVDSRKAGLGAGPRYDMGLLFTDGMTDLDDTAGYRGAVAARAAGISYRQLDYWARTGLVEPTVRGAAGSGSQRLYGFRDILVLKLVKRLLDTGISLQQIRTAVDQLRQSGVHDLAQTTLMSDGASVYLCTSDDQVIDLVSRGQGVFGIAVGKVLREVENSLVDIEAQQPDAPDELAARRASRAG